ncbi:MAG: hypothetical protein JNN22_05845 [Rhodospirillales bacterium]|nr:hypothetical protein [Rhodospirillales bacterium]
MVALPPITATSTLPGFARPAPVSLPGSGSNASQGDTAAPIGGGAASSAIANQARRTLVDQAKQAQGSENGDGSNRPRPQVPSPPFSQNVGLYDNSTRVYVDIVLSGDESRRIARVFGTPPAPAQPARPAARETVNFVA